MAKFKVGDKVRLKEGLEVGKADGGVHVVKRIVKTAIYVLDTEYPYHYAEEMLELVEEKEDKTEKAKKDFNDFLEAFMLMSQLERIVNRLDEICKSNEED